MASILLQNNEIKDASFVVKEGENLSLRLAAFSDLKDCKIEVHVEKEGVFDCAFADFSNGDGKIKIEVFLEGERASSAIRVASLAKGESKKTFEPSIHHVVGHTEGLVESYGICEEKARLVFTGVSSIGKGASKSITRQSAKIIVFDPSCLGRCSPILKIDENDVQASHAAVVGKLNDEHLFYLLSRGLDIVAARKLITQGYLIPIANYFDEEQKTAIMEAIEARL